MSALWAVAFVLLPIIGMLLVMAAVWLAQERMERSELQPKSKRFSVLSIAPNFDRDHALIWATQLPILQLIFESGYRGLAVRRLRKAYRESAGHYPEIYDGFTFPQWLEFLESVQLTSRVGRRIMLTAKGRDFLYRSDIAPAAGPR